MTHDTKKIFDSIQELEKLLMKFTDRLQGLEKRIEELENRPSVVHYNPTLDWWVSDRTFDSVSTERTMATICESPGNV